MFKLLEEYKVINLLASTTVTGDLDGTGVDVESYEADGMVVLQTGAITSTGATYVVNIQGSTALAGTYTTLASFDSFTADQYKTGAVAINVDKATNKYVRASVDTTANGGTISAIIGATLLIRPTTAGSSLNSATIA